MAYQKIGTPVFWIDTLQFLQSKGIGGPGVHPSGTSGTYQTEDVTDIFRINPTSYTTERGDLTYSNTSGDIEIRYTWGVGFPLSIDHLKNLHPLIYDNTPTKDINIGNLDYIAILNHNLASTGFNKFLPYFYHWTVDNNGEPGGGNSLNNTAQTNNMLATDKWDPYINFEADKTISNDGFSFIEIDFADVICNRFQIFGIRDYDEGGSDPSLEDKMEYGYPEIGSISIGKRYQMPSSPDLNLTQTYDYAVKEIKTKGGESLTENMWKNPKWGQLGAWELASVTNNEVDQNAVRLSSLARSGRKVYDLSFSYLDDGDVFGANQTLSLGDNAWSDIISGYEYGDDTQTDGNDNVQFTKNILNDSSFFTSVIHKTNGGQLPFIFQPNSEDKTNMVIAKLDMKSFSFKQVANGVYNIKLKIREVW